MKKPPELKPASNFHRAANLYLIVSWFILNSAFISAAPPEIVHPPRGQAVILYQQAAFGVIATGTAPLSCQWRKDGVPIVGATNDQIVIAQSQFSDAGRYSVLVSNAEATATSAEAVLTVNPPQAGDVDFSFLWGGSINGDVELVVVQPDGKILIGGGFSTVHRAARDGIARLNGDGSTDHTFLPDLSAGTGVFGRAYSVATQSDGKVLVSGVLLGNHCLGGCPGMVRLNADGTRDRTFQADLSGWNPYLRAFAMQSNGKVIVAGGTVDRSPLVARLYANGTLDSAFKNGLNGQEISYVRSIAVQSDDKVIIAGGNGRIIRLNADGFLDRSFQAQIPSHEDFGQSWLTSIRIQSNGKLLVSGGFTTAINGVRRTGFARLNSDGTVDAAFQAEVSGGDETVDAIAVQSDGKVLIGGQFTTVNGVEADNFARLNSDGTLDRTFQQGLLCAGHELYLGVRSIALQSDGKVLLGGNFTAINGVSRNRIARLNADGTLDSGFRNGSSGANDVASVVEQSDGKLLIGGSFTSVNGVSRNRIARLNADGSLDSSFLNALPGADNQVSSIAVQSDRKVLIGGSFSAVNGARSVGIARLKMDGRLDSSFQIGYSGLFENVHSIAVQSDGGVLVGSGASVARIKANGTFEPQGLPREKSGGASVARIKPDGTLDSNFNGPLSGADDFLSSIMVQSDDKVIISGQFSTVGGLGRTNLARLNADGNVDNSFQTGASHTAGMVSSVALQRDGKVLIAGGLCSPVMYFQVCDLFVSRLNPDGTVDSGFQTEFSGVNQWINSVAVQNDGRVLVGGWFTTIKDVNRKSIARFNADGTLDNGFQNGLSGVNGSIRSLAVQGGDKVLVAGDFIAINGMPAAGIARLWTSADIPPRITNLNRSGAGVELSWEALPNRLYRVQYNDSLVADTWIDLPGDVPGSITGAASNTHPASPHLSQRFYRLLLLPSFPVTNSPAPAALFIENRANSIGNGGFGKTTSRP